MPDLTALSTSVAIALLLVVMLWFALGTQRNIGRGNAVLRWLQAGLPLLGKRATLRWLGSSAVVLGITEPEDPFRQAEVLVVLEPRDVPWLWALARGRGRRDFVIVRASLRRPPRFGLEAADSEAWTGRDGLDRAGDGGAWAEVDWGDPGVRALHTGGPDVAGPRRAWQRLASATGGVWRLSIQPTVPHLEIHLLPPSAFTQSSETLFRSIRDLGRELSRET